ncbi:MAG: NUDIX hydrolase [Actinobacteria bacterium]|nr:MAG: NUDIX hydrolase [Actinomycetota bacterium]
MSLRINALDTLSTFNDGELGQLDLRQRYLRHIEVNEDGFEKKCVSAHITVSALVLDHTHRKVLLTLHPKVGRWLQLGGHCEVSDASLAAAALREAREESGLEVFDFLIDGPVQLDAHTINCGGDGLVTHLDVQFVLVAHENQEIAISNESLDLKWFDSNDLPQDCDFALVRLLDKAQQILAH